MSSEIPRIGAGEALQNLDDIHPQALEFLQQVYGDDPETTEALQSLTQPEAETVVKRLADEYTAIYRGGMAFDRAYMAR